MSDYIKAPEGDRRETTPEEVTFKLSNPNARLSQRAIEAIARLLLAAEHEAPVAQQDNTARPKRNNP